MGTSNLQLPFESQLQQLASLHQHQHHPSFPSTPHSRSPSPLISSTLCVTRAAVAVATASHPHRIVQYSTVQYLRVRHPPPPSSSTNFTTRVKVQAADIPSYTLPHIF